VPEIQNGFQSFKDEIKNDLKSFKDDMKKTVDDAANAAAEKAVKVCP
jgi:F0F1-type ATP synthase membrane subunit b/b'